jgi:hypothetical protein
MVIKLNLLLGISLLVFNLNNVFAASKKCHLEREIVSLAGPITTTLEALGLLKDPKLLAISSFNPIRGKTKATILAGGMFLAKKTFKKYETAEFFIDKSRELEKTLKRSNIENYQVLDTRGMDSFEVLAMTLLIIEPHLKNCDKKIKKLNLWGRKITSNLARLKQKKLIFFLGKIKNKLPSLIIGQDGFVLALLRYAKVKTYKSNLAYIAWSQKELKKYPHYQFIGVSTTKELRMHFEPHGKNQWNISYLGALIPGVTQIRFLEKFLKLSFI